MKKSKFDILISITITISILLFIYYLLLNGSKKILHISEVTFAISSILIIIHLLRNITLKKKPKIVEHNLNYEDIINVITNNLINDGFVLGIEEIKENIRIKHYKKEKDRNSMFMISVTYASIITNDLIDVINNSIENQCKKDKHENINYLYSIPLLIVEETNPCFFDNINIKVLNNMITLICGISLKDKKLYLLEKDMKENMIKYHVMKEKLFEILKINGVDKNE